MLVITRQLHERIYIGDEVVIQVVRIGPGKVRLGIEAPPRIEVRRDDYREPDREEDRS